MCVSVTLHSTLCAVAVLTTHHWLRGLKGHSSSWQGRHLPRTSHATSSHATTHLPTHLPTHLHLAVLVSRAHTTRAHAAGTHATHAARTH